MEIQINNATIILNSDHECTAMKRIVDSFLGEYSQYHDKAKREYEMEAFIAQKILDDLSK